MLWTSKLYPYDLLSKYLEVEENLDNYAKGEFLEYLKLHLGRDGISKCVTLLFTEKLLLDINWDGKKQKRALNKFKFFNTYLFAIKKKEMAFPDFEVEMKKGFKLANNKVHKNAAKERKKLQTAME
ncbi:uncharacterized protein LOC105665251 isoform X2 [Ceratitis capitata]|uniref:uncharacterized protein LOC105665251 isoform X2 n=1 Tax=Ceratitis capitata TaxID=7213 RepID=UPI000A113F73|nr:uncharacterized protein LOC105665251 isoform X2 [Ceratitis capitata]